MIRRLSLVFLIGLTMLSGCGGGAQEASCDPKATVLYEGAPYGGLVTIMDKVNACMGTNETPHIVIYETDFYDYVYIESINKEGCYLVHGSAGKGMTIKLAKPSLESSKGQLFAEEFMHFLGVGDHKHPCMNFTWEEEPTI